MLSFENAPIGAWSFQADGGKIALGQGYAANLIQYGTAAPTSGTWVRGDLTFTQTPSAGGRLGWICIGSGTFGTLSGVTGSITNGQKWLYPNTLSGLAYGNFISIAGVTGTFRVVNYTDKKYSVSAYENSGIANGKKCTGATSKAAGTCIYFNGSDTIYINVKSGTFQSGEVVKQDDDQTKTVTLSSAAQTVRIIELSSTANATVTDAAVSFVTPTFENFGIIEDAGKVKATVLCGGVKALTYANPLSVNMNEGNVFTVTTTSGVGDSTFNATGGAAGQKATFIITNDASGNRTITFGTNFKPSGTLVGTVSKTATVSFVYDGTNWWEMCRTTGL